MEATIEFFTKGYKKPVENNYDTCNGTRKYFHIMMDDENAGTEEGLIKVLAKAVEDMKIGSGLVGESRSPGYATFRNY